MSSPIRCSLVLVLFLVACSDDAASPADLAAADSAAVDRGGADRSKRDAGPSCDDIKVELAQQVELAKVCQPQSTTTQCTRLINQDALPCGCPIYINPANTEALARVDELLASWRRKGCGVKVECKPCGTPASGSCEATAAGSKVPGLCKSAR